MARKHNRRLNHHYTRKRLCSLFGELLKASSILRYLTSIKLWTVIMKIETSFDRKEVNMIKRKGIIFHHDNARPHCWKMTLDKLRAFECEVLPQPPYSPDIAPSDYHLFGSLQHFLNNKKIKDYDAVKKSIEIFSIQNYMTSSAMALNLCHKDGR